MVFVAIILFFVYMWGFGFSITRFVKESENVLERNLMRLGLGLMLLPLVGVILNLLNIPLDWRIFLLLSLLGPVISVVKEKKITPPSISFTYTNLSIVLMLVIFAASLFIYASGAFSYPYLENDDPWGHAYGAKFISLEKNLDGSPYRGFQYMNPYPPGYDMILGVLHQTNDSVYTTVKFFNALIISLGFIFFYFAAALLTKNKGKALFATFILASVPAYLSHFIWAHALVATLFFPALYALLMMEKDKQWFVLASIGVASFALVQPTQPVKLVTMLVMAIAVILIAQRKIVWQYIAVPILGILISFLWWAFHWREFFFDAQDARLGVEGAVATQSFLAKLPSTFFAFLDPTSGTATRVYTFSDFFFAKSQNMINNPIGIGVVISLLVLVGLVTIALQYKSLMQRSKAYLLIITLWLIFTFLGINSLTFNLPIGLFAFRFWMLFAIPVSLVAAEGLWFLMSLSKQARVPAIFIIVLVMIGVIFTGGMQKYDVNTANWPPGAFWTSLEEVQGYGWLATLPPNTRVFNFITDHQIIGFDQFICSWCEDEAAMRDQGITLNTSAEEMRSWLLEHNYGYFMLGGIEVRSFGQNETVNLMQSFQGLEGVSVAHQTPGVVIFKVT